ncbi:DUF1836 domain-containing protein [Fredinandcohnia sp. 179-A 10B2 NHS]|uniref:DUF1836 domain-containing protein n=1 Tax=Fredinandcohnia sp. 179-A 10B2 NHS TaxID=3235176 RepID=UPI0039A15B4B
MDHKYEILNSLDIERNISLDDIPNIDLYMDQVIQLFENTYGPSKRNEDEKVLTKTMINNYAKGKLLVPIKNKKYSREHLILLSLIYQLKSGLSINDIKTTLDGLTQKINIDHDFNLENFYNIYLNLHKKNAAEFSVDLKMKVEDVTEEVSSLTDKDTEKLEKILLILSLTASSLFYKRAAEKLIDELASSQPPKKEK